MPRIKLQKVIAELTLPATLPVDRDKIEEFLRGHRAPGTAVSA